MAVAATVMFVDVYGHLHLLDHLDGHLLDGGDGNLDLLDDGDVVLHRVFLDNGHVDRHVHGVGGRHGEGHGVHDVLTGRSAEAAA